MKASRTFLHFLFFLSSLLPIFCVVYPIQLCCPCVCVYGRNVGCESYVECKASVSKGKEKVFPLKQDIMHAFSPSIRECKRKEAGKPERNGNLFLFFLFKAYCFAYQLPYQHSSVTMSKMKQRQKGSKLIQCWTMDCNMPCETGCCCYCSGMAHG